MQDAIARRPARLTNPLAPLLLLISEWLEQRRGLMRKQTQRINGTVKRVLLAAILAVLAITWAGCLSIHTQKDVEHPVVVPDDHPVVVTPPP